MDCGVSESHDQRRVDIDARFDALCRFVSQEFIKVLSCGVGPVNRREYPFAVVTISYLGIYPQPSSLPQKWIL
jgi:hypothetical protein